MKMYVIEVWKGWSLYSREIYTSISAACHGFNFGLFECESISKSTNFTVTLYATERHSLQYDHIVNDAPLAQKMVENKITITFFNEDYNPFVMRRVKRYVDFDYSSKKQELRLEAGL